MNRGIFVVLALVSATLVPSATAAPSRTVVYEIVRRPKSATSGEVTLHTLDGAGAATNLAVALEPVAGGGYRSRSTSASMSSGGVSGWSRYRVDLPRGHRFVAGGIRGRFRLTVSERGWSVREIGSGFRIVTASPGDHEQVAGPVERYGRVAAPGGPYGSTAYAVVPCDPGVGTWTFGTEAEPRQTQTCLPPFPDDTAFGHTAAGRQWSVEATVVGWRTWEYRLLVLDHPKR